LKLLFQSESGYWASWLPHLRGVHLFCDFGSLQTQNTENLRTWRLRLCLWFNLMGWNSPNLEKNHMLLSQFEGRFPPEEESQSGARSQR